MALLKGIDVASYQASLNVNQVYCDFVIIKATGGDGYVNPVCDTHYQQAKSAGKLRGVYHYYGDGFGGNDPIAEANWFVDNCMGYVNDAILVLDWEKGGNPHAGNVSMAKRWLDQVYARTGVKPIIYMSESLIHELNWSAVIAGGYGLWCANYVDNNTPIYNYGMDPNRDPNPHWDGEVNNVLWQFTSTGRLDGYNGNLDCNFFYGDAKAWNAYAKSNQTPPPDPTPPQPVVSPSSSASASVSASESSSASSSASHSTSPSAEPNPPDPTSPSTDNLKKIVVAIGVAIAALVAWFLAWLNN